MSVAARARRPCAPPFLDPHGYARHRPEATLLYQLVEQHYPAFRALRASADRPLPDYVQREFDAYLKCGRLEEGFLRVRCEQCHAEKLVAFSCKKRGFCPSCGARRMAETAALLADEVLPERPLRQWVLSLPHALRFLLARNPDALSRVLGVVYRTIARHLINQAGLTRATGATGAVTLVQRFGSALNLNVHFHMLFLDGVYLTSGAEPPVFRPVAAPGANELQKLVEQIAARVGQVLERAGFIERDLHAKAGADWHRFDRVVALRQNRRRLRPARGIDGRNEGLILPEAAHTFVVDAVAGSRIAGKTPRVNFAPEPDAHENVGALPSQRSLTTFVCGRYV
jgi:hypothetical protein